jgi:L-threonylcarbamoyladenylate synthase
MIVDVERGASLLLQGGVVAYPTETVYGLGADALRESAVGRLRELKGRDPGRGLSILVTGAEDLLRWAPEAPEAARRLADRFWPGPLTIVVSVGVSELTAVSTNEGVGFRCSSHPTANALAERTGRPIVSTSCNPSGEKPCISADEVTRRFGDELPIVSGEPAGGQAPSTVIAVSLDGKVQLLRAGATPFSEVCSEVPA